MRQRRDLGEQLGQNSLPCDKQLDRLDPRIERRLDEILALGGKLPELVAPAPRLQLADELERLVPR
jgi:hypothetical protein